jgi:two-component system sensor histidine kinase VicK
MLRGPRARLFYRRCRDASPKGLSAQSEHYRAALLQSITEVSADGILVVSPNRRIISTNSRMLEIWGIPPNVALSRSDELALASIRDRLAEPEGFFAKVRYLYDHPDARSWDEIFLKDGRVVERYSAPVIGPAQTRFGRVWFFRDVTARKEAERLVTKLHQDFAAAIVHDLRAPIQTILLQTNSFLQASSGGEARIQESAIRRIEKQALQLSRMTTDLLDVTTIEVGRLRLETEAVSVAALAREIADNFKPMLERHVVWVEADEPLPLVQADRHRLGQVLMNLLVNAAAYSPDGGRIDIEIRARDGGVRLSVHDQGVGIPADDLPHIFDRFFRIRQTRSARNGYGLGLYVARAFVDAHGGRINVESAPGAGSTFHVWLPVASSLAGHPV